MYGYQDQRDDKRNTWYFEAGVELTLVSTVTGMLGIPIPAALIGISGGVSILLSALTIQEWVMEYYWEVISELEDWEIEYTRDEILTSPGLYY